MKRYFDHLRTLSEVKAEYKRLVKINHPDVGGDTATMQAINAQYAEAVKRIARDGEGRDRENAAKEIPLEFVAALSKIIALDGIEIDLVGAWLWVTGETYKHRAALKAAGYKWACKKLAWYWHPEWAAVERGSRKSLDEIKDKYGSSRLVGKAEHKAPQMLAEGERPKPSKRKAAAPRKRRPVSGQVAMQF